MNLTEKQSRCGCMKPNSLQCANPAWVMVKHPDREHATATCRLDFNWLIGTLKPEEIKNYTFTIIKHEDQDDLDNILYMHQNPIEWSKARAGK